LDAEDMEGLRLPHITNRTELDRGDLLQTGGARMRYLEALRAADRRDYEPLLRFVRS